MANEEQLAILRRGTEAWNSWCATRSTETMDLSGANLSGANLSEANLSNANLSEANLSMANFTLANLSEADFKGARFWHTIFGFDDLSTCKDLEDCRHDGPSIVNFDTLQRSGSLPSHFYVALGYQTR